jgi:hypothetical protein
MGKHMEKEILPYKQTLSHGCLAADLLMLLKMKYGTDFRENDEANILLSGMKRMYPFYVVGVPKEFFNKYRRKISIIVDNKYFTNVLVKGFKDKNNQAGSLFALRIICPNCFKVFSNFELAVFKSKIVLSIPIEPNRILKRAIIKSNFSKSFFL